MSKGEQPAKPEDVDTGLDEGVKYDAARDLGESDEEDDERSQDVLMDTDGR